MNDRYRNEYNDEYGSISFGDRERDERSHGRQSGQGQRGRDRYYDEWRGYEAQRNAGEQRGGGQQRGYGEQRGYGGEQRSYGGEQRGYGEQRGHDGRSFSGASERGYGEQRGYLDERGNTPKEDPWRGFDPWRSADRDETLGWSRSSGTGARAYGTARTDASYRSDSADRPRGGFFGKGPKGYTRSDERIRDDVSDRLTDDDELDASDITVTVKDGEVTLEGTVADRRSKHHAEDIVDAVTGVKEVHNGLKTRKGFLQEVGDRLTGREESEQHGHAGMGPRNGPSATLGRGVSSERRS